MQLWCWLNEVMIVKCLAHYLASRECSIPFTWLLYNLPPKARIHAQNLSLFKNPLIVSSLPGESSVFLCWARFYPLNIYLLSICYMPSPLIYIENTAVYKISYMYPHTHLFVCLFKSPSCGAGKRNDILTLDSQPSLQDLFIGIIDVVFTSSLHDSF